MLDPVITDLLVGTVNCQLLEPVGSSDHYTVLTQVDLGMAQDEATTCTIWLLDTANRPSLRRELQQTDWATLFNGQAESMVKVINECLKTLYQEHVPHQLYASTPKDQPWFSYKCWQAVERKYSGLASKGALAAMSGMPTHDSHH